MSLDGSNTLQPMELAWPHRAIDSLSGLKTVIGAAAGALGIVLSHYGYSAAGEALTYFGNALLGAGIFHKYLKRRSGV